MIVTLLDATKNVTLFGQVLTGARPSVEVNKMALLNVGRIDGRDRSSDIKDLLLLFSTGILRVDDAGRRITTTAELQQVLSNGELDNPNAVTSFVFKPGGVASSNVFTDWAALVEAARGLEGLKHVYFDDSLQPTDIPAGEWNFGSGYTTWHGKPLHLGESLVTFQEGAVLAGGVYEFSRLSLRTVSSTAAMRHRGTFSAPAFFILKEHSIIVTEGAGPFFANNTQQPAYWVLKDDANIRTGSGPGPLGPAPALISESRTSSLLIITYDNSRVDQDTVYWLPNTGASGLVVHPTAQVSADQFGRTMVVNYEHPSIRYGIGSPEGVLEGYRGNLYVDLNGGKGTTLYVKEADDGLATGWGAK